MAAGFGFKAGELLKIERDFQAIQQRMGELTQQTGRIKSVIAKAAATDLASGMLGGNILGFGAVVGQVRQQVEAIQQRVTELEAAKEKLTKGLSDDTRRIGAVIKRYEEAERRAHEGVSKPGKGTGQSQPKSPGQQGEHKPTTRPGHKKPGPQTPPGPKHPGGNGHDKHPGGDGHDPKPTVSNQGKIDKSQVTFGGKGSYKSGEAACREYIGQALDAMGITDPKAREAWTRGMLTIAERESSYNSPNWQVNQDAAHDVNVNGPVQSDHAALNCSRGGWQTTPGTFAANHVKGTSTDIYDPVANAAASMQYCMSRYGVSPDGHDLAAKVQQADPHRKPHWY